jgi:hypothetical protein
MVRINFAKGQGIKINRIYTGLVRAAYAKRVIHEWLVLVSKQSGNWAQFTILQNYSYQTIPGFVNICICGYLVCKNTKIYLISF